MRSIQVSKPGADLKLTEQEIPCPGPGEVRVHVHSCGICHSDSFAVAGIPGGIYPLIPGHEISGTVDAVGADVTDFEPGTRVGIGWFGGQCGGCASCRRGDFVMCPNIKAPGLLRDGGYAEYVVVPATALARVPEGVDTLDVGPLMCAGLTAFNALRNGGVRPGERVAVLGIGGTGHLALQFANHMGCEVVAISRGTAKRRLALDMGAHHFIDSLDDSAERQLSGIGGLDVIITTASSGSTVTNFISCLAPRGRIVVTGFSPDDLRVSPMSLISRSISIVGSAAGTAKDAEEMLDFSLRAGIRPVVEPVPLADAVGAYERTLAGQVTFRAVLTIGDDAAASRLASGGRASGVRASPVPLDGVADGVPSVLDCPPSHVPDGEELIEAAMRWHFSPETGSPFWLERAVSLGFDPREDVHTLADLRKFPNITDELRNVNAMDLIPRGYGEAGQLLGVYESGGATGAPKRVILMQDWLDRWASWAVRVAEQHNYPRNANWLALAPSGPHVFGHMIPLHARLLGGTAFTVDLDPRWVRRLISENRAEEAERYTDHIIDQADYILRSQNIGILVITPPLLERFARNDKLAELVRKSVRLISWAGTHMDADTRHLYRTEIFPGIDIRGNYGNTMLLGGAAERPEATADTCIFDPFSPYISFAVIDPETGAEVSYGARGRVIMHHVSKSMLIPNNLDRDMATRVRPLAGQMGDSIGDVSPVSLAIDENFGQGVY